MAISWLKTGKESAKLAKQEEAEAEKRKSEQGKMFRFWLTDKEEAKVTFIDGDLSPEGFLLPPRLYEHNLFLSGQWNNFFVCPEKTNPDSSDPCPICEGGDRPALIALFTIIDHRTFKSKDGTKQYKDQRRLLVVKAQTMEMFSKIALKRGGLAGATFDVSRNGDKAPAIGGLWDFTEKRPIKGLEALYVDEVVDPKTNTKSKVTRFRPADYEKELVYRSSDELRKLGFGKASVMGSPMSPGGNADDVADYSGHL